MDAAFIRDNQVIERYLAGKLPLRGAQDFERWCRENPDTIAELGLSERINAALRLLDAAGEPLPWTQPPVAAWQKLPVFLGLAAVAVLTTFAAAALFVAGQQKNSELAGLERRLDEQPLMPVQATRPIHLTVSRDGPLSGSQAAIGRGSTVLADFRFDLAWSRYNLFTITIDRVDQGRALVVNNLARDSNGHLRLGLNSSALGPGDYSVQIEGLDLRRGAEPQGWARFSITR